MFRQLHFPQGLARLSMSKLILIAILTPSIAFIAWEIFEHRFIQAGIIITTAVIVLGASAFTFTLFGIIKKVQHELIGQSKKIAVLEERERIALEMHDDLAQVLGSITARLKALDMLAKDGRREELTEHIAQIQRIVQESYADVRECILGLKTFMTKDGDFLKAVSDFIISFSRQNGISIELTGKENYAKIPATAEVQLIRIIQEALCNIRKHSGAARAFVKFEQEGGNLNVTVEDHGHGFDMSHLQDKYCMQFGLKAMKDRAEIAGGSLKVLSWPGEGTRVTVQIPREGK